MNALWIWCVLPAGLAVVLYVLRRFGRAVYLACVGISLLMAWTAWVLPVGQAIPLRLWSGLPPLRIEPELIAFGSRFAITNSTRQALVLIYLSLGFWIGGSGAAGTHRLFPPLGLATAALLSTALAADGVAAQALLIAPALLVCIPIVSPPGEPARRGALRFMVYGLGGVCLVLFADASLNAAATAAALNETMIDSGRNATALLMLAMGFALILAVVPFHTWMPMLGEEANPYAAAFIFFVLPLSASFLAFEALGQYSISGLTPTMFDVLRSAGALMAIAGGVGAAFERHLGRTMGFAAIASLGMTLIAISLNDQLGRATPQAGIFFGQIAPRGLALAIWGLGLTVMRGQLPDLDHATLRGAGRALPTATAAVVLANLALAGMPVTVGFPAHLALWTASAPADMAAAVVSLMGMGGLALGALRSLIVLVQPPAETPETLPTQTSKSWRMYETKLQAILLLTGVAILVLAGLFPQVYLPTLTNMAMRFAGALP